MRKALLFPRRKHHCSRLLQVLLFAVAAASVASGVMNAAANVVASAVANIANVANVANAAVRADTSSLFSLRASTAVEGAFARVAPWWACDFAGRYFVSY